MPRSNLDEIIEKTFPRQKQINADITEGRELMNESWKRIFKEYIECHNAIQILASHKIIEGEEVESIRWSLLEDIIETMRSEVEE